MGQHRRPPRDRRSRSARRRRAPERGGQGRRLARAKRADHSLRLRRPPRAPRAQPRLPDFPTLRLWSRPSRALPERRRPGLAVRLTERCTRDCRTARLADLIDTCSPLLLVCVKHERTCQFRHRHPEESSSESVPICDRPLPCLGCLVAYHHRHRRVVVVLGSRPTRLNALLLTPAIGGRFGLQRPRWLWVTSRDTPRAHLHTPIRRCGRFAPFFELPGSGAELLTIVSSDVSPGRGGSPVSQDRPWLTR